MVCGRFGYTELLVLGGLLVLLFGASRLPEIGRGLGLGIRKFKKGLRDEGDDETTPPASAESKNDK